MSCWSCEELTGNEVFPCDTLQAKLMYNNDLDECIMVNAIVLLFRSIILHKSSHLFNVSAHEIWNVHHLYSREMHQQSDMVCIEAWESALTTEVSSNESHRRCIWFFQKPEWEHPAELFHIVGPNVWFIMYFFYLLSFVPLLTYIQYSGFLRNGLWCQGEIYTSKSYLTIM